MAAVVERNKVQQNEQSCYQNGTFDAQTRKQQLINHFEYHRELSRKPSLFINMQAFSEQIQENVFNYHPITFCFDLAVAPHHINAQIHTALKPFMTFYNILETNKDKVLAIHAEVENRKQEPFKVAKPAPIVYDKRNTGSYTRYTMPLGHFKGQNLWLLKPANLNRGRGVHVFNSLEELKKLLLVYYQQGLDQKYKQKTLSFVLQKYIESPLLVNERKFDIRMWVLVTHEMDCYLFKEGYLRTSSSKFVMDPDDADNKFVHLTNNAVQRYAKNYGEFEDGNQMSFVAFQEYLDKNYAEKGIRVGKDILPQIKNIVKKTVLAVRKKLNLEGRKYCFEIFGYDFIIDSDFNVWLIEINTNPCLEESSKLLKSVLPRMIDNAFKLTVDILFPPLPQYMTFPKKIYPIEGYPDDMNLWYLIQPAKTIGNQCVPQAIIAYPRLHPQLSRGLST
eukprot:TRINITY_DN3872_c0_g1_i1.p1 TRINITY_DN3872_c0_g1~~TRINITY_DN3872_c0_g1_i1.p1  ORF type:complete len:448 (-),score=27.98 TRINITY_DN3872_c0_g1_i1:2502-3845(-)